MPTEDEGMEEVVDELLEEVEEEEDQLPPGYRVADGPYKPFCTCQDNVTCSFCSWFHLIRECTVHGRATEKPPKPCTCQKSNQELQLFPSLLKSYQSSHGSRFIDPCECGKTITIAECDCLNIPSEASTVESAKDDKPLVQDNFDDEPQGEFEVAGEEHVVEEEEENVVGEDGIESSRSDETVDIELSVKRHSIQDKKPPQPCTCDEEPQPRSGSSSELESSISESSDTDGSSEYDLGLFENLEGTSSEASSSEDSSVEGTDVDWTVVKWIHNASDRSVESVSDDDFDDRVKRQRALKKVQSRPKRRRYSGKTAARPARYQYLVVQESRAKKFLDICKGKKDQPRSYSYNLMRIV